MIINILATSEGGYKARRRKVLSVYWDWILVSCIKILFAKYPKLKDRIK